MYAAIRQEKPVRIRSVRNVATVAPPPIPLFSIGQMRVIDAVTSSLLVGYQCLGGPPIDMAWRQP